MDMVSIALIAIAVLGAIFVFMGIQMVSQSNEYVVERLGKYNRPLKAGINFIIPILDRVSYQVVVLERQISKEPERISVITKDNVEINLWATVFYRLTDASKSVYRIQYLVSAIKNAVTSTVRSTCPNV